jgi:hypothetical protein
MNRSHRLPLVLILFGILVFLHISLSPAGPGVTSASAEPWLHVKVVESAPDGETVRVNVPLSLVEALVPLLDHAQEGDDDAEDEEDARDAGHTSRRHHHGMTINNHDITPAEVRALLEAFRQAEDGEYVAVDGVDEKVRVTKSGGLFLVDVEDRGEEREHVKVKIRMEVLDALLSGGKDELNFAAAAKSLRNYAGEDLVTVTSEDETVRIWIDEKKTTE